MGRRTARHGEGQDATDTKQEGQDRQKGLCFFLILAPPPGDWAVSLPPPENGVTVSSSRLRMPRESLLPVSRRDACDDPENSMESRLIERPDSCSIFDSCCAEKRGPDL